MRHVKRSKHGLLLSLMLAFAFAAPGSISADRAIRFSNHFVSLECFTTDGPYLSAGSSTEFGEGAIVESPEIVGHTSNVQVTESGGGATIEAVIPLTDWDGNAAGEAVLNAVLTPTGNETTIDERFHDGNRKSVVTGVAREMAVSGTLVIPGSTIDLAATDCFAEIGDVEVFETQPHSLVGGNSGIAIDCFWETADAFAYLFVINDEFGSFADAGLFTAEHTLFLNATPDVTLTAELLDATIPLFDEMTGLEESATANATLEASGEPEKWVAIGQNFRNRTVAQQLSPEGELSFSTGQSFPIDDESCTASTFDSHVVGTNPSGPRAGGPSPVNDTPEGALPLSFRRAVNQQTKGTDQAPEMQVTTCPEGPFDAFGHTLWYTFTGTGGEVTIQTAGSNIDTVIAVYDDNLTELACEDDVPVGNLGYSLQAALTIDTVEGATYYVQAGGFDPVGFIGESSPEFGRLRIKLLR